MLNSLAASLGATLEASFWPALADRAVLVVNHLLRSQDAAAQRLVAHAGKRVFIDWSSADPRWPKPPALWLVVTSAGLFETTSRPDAMQPPDGLRLEVDLPAPTELPRFLVEGRRPTTRIEGDTALAADLAWLAENLRWDAEHDLARLIGDLPARTLVMAGQTVLSGLRSLVPRARPSDDGQGGERDFGAAAPR